MVFAEDDDVIETLASHASAESFHGGVHSGGAGSRLLHRDVRSFSDTVEYGAVLRVSVTNEELRASPEPRSRASVAVHGPLDRALPDADTDLEKLSSTRTGRVHSVDESGEGYGAQPQLGKRPKGG